MLTTRMVKELILTGLLPQKVVQNLITNILEEAVFSDSFTVIRIFAVLLSYISKKLLSGIFVNERQILQIKETDIGKNPIIFLPSHKSYCDFLTMAYVFFHYEIEIPKIAAGSDFQQMKMFGNLLRKTGAFYMRRSFKEDKMYSKTFSTFVETMIEKGGCPVEFFIEGTRSRTTECLVPKIFNNDFKTIFFGKVPNITLIPVNLSYDRILEELLFAIELLGVPKPKESTEGLIKALSVLKTSSYGNIYINFGNPISVKKYFETTLDRSIHGFGPVHSQELSLNEKEQISHLAHSIITQQRELTVLNTFNLIALILNDNLVTSHEPLSVNELLSRVLWIFSVLKILTPKTVIFAITDFSKEDILYHLKLHEPLMHQTVNEKVQFGKVYTQSSKIDLMKGRTHVLSDDIIEIAIPLIMLQNYLNPCAFFLINVSFVSLIIQSCPTKIFIPKAELFSQFQFLCTVFYYKFAFHNYVIEKNFEDAIAQSQSLNIINIENNDIKKGGNDKLHDFCYNFCFSYIPGYVTATEILVDFSKDVLSEKQIIEFYQERIQSEFRAKKDIHLANLSVGTLKNALQAFTSMKALQVETERPEMKYKVNEEKMRNIQEKLKCLYPAREIHLNFLKHFSNFTTSRL